MMDIPTLNEEAPLNPENQLELRPEATEQAEERLTVEGPTEIQAGRSSADCYACSTLGN